MVTLGDLAKPYDQMSEEAKRAFMECLEKSCEDQNELLRKAKEMEEDGKKARQKDERVY